MQSSSLVFHSFFLSLHSLNGTVLFGISSSQQRPLCCCFVWLAHRNSYRCLHCSLYFNWLVAMAVVVCILLCIPIGLLQWPLLFVLLLSSCAFLHVMFVLFSFGVVFSLSVMLNCCFLWLLATTRLLVCVETLSIFHRGHLLTLGKLIILWALLLVMSFINSVVSSLQLQLQARHMNLQQ